jgi:hypothetical protein
MRSNVMHILSPGFRSVFFSLAFIILLASCMDEEDRFVSEPVEVAYVSIYHASPDAPDFDIIVDNRTINRNPFDYTSYSGYLNFFTGNRSIQFNSVNANNALIDTTFNFEEGKAYSLFAINRLSRIEALLVIDRAAAPSEGKAMVRFVHLSPDAPAFDISVPDQTGSPLFEDKSFKQAADFQEIEADAYTFEVKNAGGSEVVLSAEDVNILPGRFYTIITRGFVNPPQGNTNVLSLEVID